ncbi:hypothetical protein LCGC14_2138670 [marine sediment metagenome]|uniref:Uncharacterized protein n=1 Tax=marine sediment metagenome TaxID=412755 RepID=A0A0F9DZ99_9ZZZZ
MARKKRTFAQWLFGSPLQMVGALTFVGGVAYYINGGVVEQGTVMIDGIPGFEWRVRQPFWTDRFIAETRSIGSSFWSFADTAPDIDEARRIAGAL